MPENDDAPKKSATKKKAAKKTTKRAKSAGAKTAKKTTKKAAPAASAASAGEAPAAPASESKKKAKPKAAAAGRLRVKQVRSTIHRPKTFKRTLVALGLKHHQDEVVVVDTPSVRGMLRKVRHLVNVKAEVS